MTLAALTASCRRAEPDERPPLPAAAVTRDSLRFTVAAPAEARVGDAVAITLRLTNTGGRPVELYLRGREVAFDISVTDHAVVVVWQRLAGAVIPGILQVKVLGPGETLELKDVWRPAAPGAYSVQGVLPTDEPEPLRTPVAPIRVHPR